MIEILSGNQAADQAVLDLSQYERAMSEISDPSQDRGILAGINAISGVVGAIGGIMGGVSGLVNASTEPEEPSTPQSSISLNLSNFSNSPVVTKEISLIDSEMSIETSPRPIAIADTTDIRIVRPADTQTMDFIVFLTIGVAVAGAAGGVRTHLVELKYSSGNDLTLTGVNTENVGSVRPNELICVKFSETTSGSEPISIYVKGGVGPATVSRSTFISVYSTAPIPTRSRQKK